MSKMFGLLRLWKDGPPLCTPAYISDPPLLVLRLSKLWLSLLN